MGDAVFKLFATLGLDTSEYDKSLDNSESKGSKFGKGLKTATKVAAGAVAAVTASTVAGTKAFVDGISSVAKYGDNIEKTSQKIGLSSSKFQEWDYVMNIAGTSMNNMTMGLKTLTNQLDNAKNGNADAIAKFQQLGLSFEDIKNMSREEVFEAAIYGFQGMAESTERAALANDLFGRSGQELTPLFNMTQSETKELIKTANEYGMVMSEDAVNASATFQDSLTTMQGTMSGFKNRMLSQFLPSFSTIMDGLSLLFSGDSKSGLGMIKEGIKVLSGKISELTPTLIEIGGTLVESLTTAVVDNLPMFIESGLNAVSKFTEGIIDNADTLITAAERIINIFTNKLLDPTRASRLTQTAINIVLKLMNGITEALPKLIPAIAQIIVAIVTTLTQPDNLSMLIQGSLDLILALADGLIKALPILISVIPQIIVNLVQALIENFPLVLQTVLQLIGMLAIGILEALASLMGTSLEDVGEGLEYGKELLLSWGKGVISWIANLGKSIGTSISNIWNAITGFFSNGIENIKSKVQAGLDLIKSKFTSIFDGVKNTVKNALDFLKGLFKFDWKLPKIKLPHFSISGKFSLNPPSIPTFKVSWYKKAYEEPYLLNGATIFGAMNGNLLGGGERGSELIVGTNKLMTMIKKATGGQRPINIVINASEGQDIRALAKEVGKELQNILDDEDGVYA